MSPIRFTMVDVHVYEIHGSSDYWQGENNVKRVLEEKKVAQKKCFHSITGKEMLRKSNAKSYLI